MYWAEQRRSRESLLLVVWNLVRHFDQADIGSHNPLRKKMVSVSDHIPREQIMLIIIFMGAEAYRLGDIPLELGRARHHRHPFSSQIHSDQSSERADPFDLLDLLPDRVDIVFTRKGLTETN
jgi:hypothetical protein